MEEFDVVVIGSGPGGYVAAIRAAQLGLKTACMERYPVLGGTCLNVGCIPSKSLLHSSEFYWKIQKEAKENGIETGGLAVNFAAMMQRKKKIVSGFNQGISGLFKKNKVSHLIGHASFKDPHTLTIASDQEAKEIKAKHVIIATGSKPASLPFLPLNETNVISSTGALSLAKIPKKMLVVGAGIIGVELGSVYSRLGSEVHFIEFLDRVCPTLDRGLSKSLQQILAKQGLSFQLSTKVVDADIAEQEITLMVEDKDGKKQSHKADAVLVSIGRVPYTKDLGLGNAGIELDPKGYIPVDSNFRTSQRHILAIGDVIGGAMLAHKASEEGIAAAELIAGERPELEYITIPSVIYTYPEVAAVGFTEEEAKERGLEIAVGQFPFKANSRASCTDDKEGLVKILADRKTGIILGLHIISAHAGELIHEGVLALKKRATAMDLAETSHAHPTLAEAIKEAALAIAKQMIHL